MNNRHAPWSRTTPEERESGHTSMAIDAGTRPGLLPNRGGGEEELRPMTIIRTWMGGVQP